VDLRPFACAAVLLLPLLPATGSAEQPNAAVPLASVRTTTSAGLESSATLYYDPDFHTYKLTYLLEPEQENLYHERGTPQGVYYLFQSVLRDDAGLYACYTNMDGTARPAETAIGVRNAQVDPVTMGTCKTRECHEDDGEQVCGAPTLHYRVGSPIGELRWELYAGIVGVSHEDDPDPSVLMSFFNNLRDGLLIVMVCAAPTVASGGAFGSACPIALELALGSLIGLVSHYEQVDAANEDEDVFLHQQTMLATNLTITGVPTIQATLASIPDGHDTFDVIEYLFYHPDSPIPFAKDGPYGGGFSTGAGAWVSDSFGVVGRLEDLNSKVWQALPEKRARFEGGSTSDGDFGKIVRHAIPYLGTLRAGSGGGTEWSYNVYSFWDYEFPNEETVDDLVDFGQTGLAPSSRAFDWQVDYEGVQAMFMPSGQLGPAQGPVVVPAGLAALPSELRHNATAKGIVGDAWNEQRQVYLIDFDPFPVDLFCLSICTASGGEPVVYTAGSPLEKEALVAAIDAYRAEASLPEAYYMTMGVNALDRARFGQDLDLSGYYLEPWSSSTSLLAPLGFQTMTEDEEAFPDYDIPLYFIVYVV
jgi:hypothetical protein